MPLEESRAVVARARGTLPALDSMRAVASIAVLATHASFWGGAYAREGYGTALARLDIGVAIFFVLSGFLLSRAWFEQHAHRAPAPRTNVYFWHRLLRIYPMYAVAAVAALVLLPGNDDASLLTWAQTLTLTNIYADTQLPDGLTQMWSLATEVAFYLVLPLLMWLVLGRRRERLTLVLTGMLVANIGWLVASATVLSDTGANVTVWLPGYLSWFGVGIAIAAAAVRLEAGPDAAGSVRVADTLQRMGRSPGTCWVAALALFAIVSTPIAGPASLSSPAAGEAIVKNVAYAVIAGLVILPGVFALPSGAYIKTLSWAPLRHLGRISYGIFCVHLVILELVARWRDMELFAGRTLELFTLTLVISIAVSEVLYRVVERPALRWKNVFDRPSSSTSASSTPSPANTSS
ncbi:acyltransferase [Nocardioides sp. SR21]|uniref:acyltransferase family protein n=1 Tax=Nocardioides sp. SR21 TaxID=2919501 RepID=UPI001FA9B106|nr:acyltransferase [Nocardioides sp. SR21]